MSVENRFPVTGFGEHCFLDFGGSFFDPVASLLESGDGLFLPGVDRCLLDSDGAVLLDWIEEGTFACSGEGLVNVIDGISLDRGGKTMLVIARGSLITRDTLLLGLIDNIHVIYDEGNDSDDSERK